MRRWTPLALLIFSGPALLAAPEKTEKADTPAESESFIRVARNDRGTPTSMETAIARYSNGKAGDDEVTVELVSAIHVGDKSYYDALNKLFTTYEALLYELVAPEGSTPADRPKDADSHPIAAMQQGLKDLLGLDHQLAVIDYEKPNFIHADMSPLEFEKAMQNRGESFMTLFFRLAMEGVKQQQKSGGGEGEDLKMLMALISPNRALALKRIMSDQFEQLESISAGLDGPSGSAILTDRNKRCLEVLRKTLDSGKRNIGIFYGAAHMPDMEKRLADDFGLHRTESRWLVAWDMKDSGQTSEFLKKFEENRKKRGMSPPKSAVPKS